MKLEIITPEKALFKGDVKLIQVPGEKGAFQILNQHAPIISTLQAGEIRIITNDDKEQNFYVDSGVVECNSNHIQILIENE
jgi:F-type H+-transporting ATPase subunit epsilon